MKPVLLNFSTSDNAFLAIWLVISLHTLVWPYTENAYAEETKFLWDKAAGKSRFRELSNDETTLPFV